MTWNHHACGPFPCHARRALRTIAKVISERTLSGAHGSIQSVGYRRFVAHLAQTLDLAGWVRNDPDGSVHGAAEGPEDALELFRARLAQGSPYAQVTQLDWTPLDVRSSLPHPFDIRR